MNDDDLQRRLEKLVALKEHPSTLPAIRAEAARAEERLRGYIDDTESARAETPAGHYRRRDIIRNAAFAQRARLRRHGRSNLADFLDDLDRLTAEVAFPWAGIVGVDR